MRYSYSRLSAVLKCEAQYAWRYIDKYYPKVQGIEAFVGTICHEVIEADHKQRLQGTEPWDLFSKLWDQKSAGQQLNDVRNRGQQYWKDYGLNCINHYLQMGRPLDEVMGIEMRFEQPIGVQGDTLMGFADRVVMSHPPTGIVIEDFKTGKKPDKKYFLNDHQLPIYAELARRHYGFPEETNIEVARLYLATGTRASYMTDQGRRNEAWTWAQQGITKDKTLRVQFAIDRDVEFDDGPLCGWCSYKPICPMFSKPDTTETDKAATFL